MKKVRFFLFFVATSLFTTSIISCSDNEEEETGPLIYKESVLKDFKIYAGSPSGAKEVNSNDFNPKDYWEDYDLDQSGRYGKESVTFSGNELTFKDEKETVTLEYKIEDGKLFSYDPEYQEWSFIAYGNTSEFRIVTTYAMYKTANDTKLRTYNDEYHTLETVLEIYDISSAQALTNPADTIAWCNIEAIFRK